MHIKTPNIFLPAISAVVAIAAVLAFVSYATHAKAEADSLKCTTSTIAAASVGHQQSTQTVATTSNRAYTRLQLPQTSAGVATNTVALALNNGGAATLSSGLKLSTSTPYIEFGLNTDFPYEGAVQAISDTGSTTIQVTTCVY